MNMFQWSKVLTACFVLIVTTISFSFAEGEKEEKKASSENLLEKIFSLPLEATRTMDQSLGETLFNLGEIKVSGNRVSSELSDEPATEIAHNITLIGEKEIHENGSQNLPEILNQHEGVTYTDDLGQGLNARVDLRGFGGEGKQALVLFDGIRAVEPFDNSVTWSLFPKEFVQRVEIQRGGGSTVYGEGALSGVIQLKTKEPTEKLKLSSQNSWGNLGTQKYFADASGTTQGIGFYIGAYNEDTAGYRKNSDHEGTSVLVKLRSHLTDLVRVENSFYFSGYQTGIPGPLTEAEEAQDRRQKSPAGQFGDGFDDSLIQDNLTLNYFLERLGIELTNVFGYRLRTQDSDQTFGGAFPGQSINKLSTETFTDVLQGDWVLEGNHTKSSFTGGSEWSIDDIHNPFTFNDFTYGPFSSDRAIDRRMAGIFLQNYSSFWDRLILETGLRWDDIHWNIYDLLSPELQKRKKTNHLSPKAGLEFKILETLSAYASYSESFKAPDANTLIFETPNIFSPSPNIDAQVARHHEIGLRYAHPIFGSVRLDAFYIETKKEILFNDITNTNENFDTKRRGFELGNELAITRALQVFSNYTYTSAEFDQGAFGGRVIPLVPKSKWAGGFLWSPIKNWSLSGQAAGVQDQFALNDFNNKFPMKNYWTLGGKIAYHRGPFEFFVRGENLLNKKYNSFVTSNGVDRLDLNPAPTRYFEGGFRMEI